MEKLHYRSLYQILIALVHLHFLLGFQQQDLKRTHQPQREADQQEAKNQFDYSVFLSHFMNDKSSSL